MNFILSLLFLSALNGAVGDSNLRGLQSNGYDEWLGNCQGATGGLWGDPHIITFDNLNYECQGIGIFTLTQNHMWNIQGNFVDVGAVEHASRESRGLPVGASLTNDVAIEYVYDESVPIFQFGFGDLPAYTEKYLYAEEDCMQWKYFNVWEMPNTWRTVEATIVVCRERCENYVGCTAFNYWEDGGCHLHDENSQILDTPDSWSRSVVGYIDNRCGIPTPPPESPHPEEADMHGEISADCPLLMYVDGVMMDLSGSNGDGMLYGEKGDEHYVERIGNTIDVVNVLENGEQAKAHLIAKGGLQHLFSCHWDFYICLPQSQQAQFQEYSVGILGTPDGNCSNDWMDADGTTIEIQNNHVDSYNYCVDNWCVNQESSLMSFAEDNTFNDYKCEDQPFIDFSVDSPSCVLSADKIKEKCENMLPLMIHACQIECCIGGCDDIEPTVEEVVTIIELTDIPPEVVFEVPDFSDCEEDGSFKSTSDTACPASINIPSQLSGNPYVVEGQSSLDEIVGSEASNVNLANIFNNENVGVKARTWNGSWVRNIYLPQGSEVPVNAKFEISVESTWSVRIHYPKTAGSSELRTKEVSEDENVVFVMVSNVWVAKGDPTPTSPGTPIVTLLGSKGNVPLPEGADVFYGMVTDMEPHNDVFGTTVKFKVNNPFNSNADVYVKHEKSVQGNFNDPHCVKFDDTAGGGCAATAEVVEVACRLYDGFTPFALVTVYFASSDLATDSSVNVDKCCEASDYPSGIGVVEYTFEVKCNCPASDATIE